MIGTEFREGDPLSQWNAALTPCVQPLATQPEALANDSATKSVDQSAISVSMRKGHSRTINTALTDGNRQSLIEINNDESSTDDMGDLAKTISDRIRQRLDEMRLTPADLARGLGYTPQRINNYIHRDNPRACDVETLVRIARELRTTPDWLLGVSEDEQTVKTQEDDQRDADRLIEASAPIVRWLLSLVDLPDETTDAVAHAAQEALQALLAFSDEADAQTQARLAAQLAWQITQKSKPS